MFNRVQRLFLFSVGCGIAACSGAVDNEGEDTLPGNTGAGGGMVINVPTAGTSGNATQNGGTRVLTPEQTTQIRGGACAGWAAEGEQLPAILELVVDVSGSMDDPAPGTRESKWDVTRDALATAINGLAPSTGVGALYYPNGGTPSSTTPQNVNRCVNTQAMVPVSLLGTANSPQRRVILDSLNRANPANYTPTHDAYHHALEFGLKSFQTTASKFMLLITDGAPTMSLGCIRPGQGVVDMPTDPIIAEIAAAKAAGIKTFIIGSPGSEKSSESNGDMRPWLSRAAEAGGTAQMTCNHAGPNFCHMDMTTAPNFADALASGLKSVATQISSCVYSIPAPPAGKTLDKGAINLIVHGQSQSTLILPDAQGKCSEGWNYDADGNIVLCSTTCSAVKADPSARVELLFGCASGEVPIF